MGCPHLCCLLFNGGSEFYVVHPWYQCIRICNGCTIAWVGYSFVVALKSRTQRDFDSTIPRPRLFKHMFRWIYFKQSTLVHKFELSEHTWKRSRFTIKTKTDAFMYIPAVLKKATFFGACGCQVRLSGWKYCNRTSNNVSRPGQHVYLFFVTLYANLVLDGGFPRKGHLLFVKVMITIHHQQQQIKDYSSGRHTTKKGLRFTFSFYKKKANKFLSEHHSVLSLSVSRRREDWYIWNLLSAFLGLPISPLRKLYWECRIDKMSKLRNSMLLLSFWRVSFAVTTESCVVPIFRWIESFDPKMLTPPATISLSSSSPGWEKRFFWLNTRQIPKNWLWFFNFCELREMSLKKWYDEDEDEAYRKAWRYIPISHSRSCSPPYGKVACTKPLAPYAWCETPQSYRMIRICDHTPRNHWFILLGPSFRCRGRSQSTTQTNIGFLHFKVSRWQQQARRTAEVSDWSRLCDTSIPPFCWWTSPFCCSSRRFVTPWTQEIFEEKVGRSFAQ